MNVSSAVARPDRKSTRLNSSHTVIYTLSLHDALPICSSRLRRRLDQDPEHVVVTRGGVVREDERLVRGRKTRSEEHTSELQSHRDLHSFPTRRSSDLLVSVAPSLRPGSRTRRRHSWRRRSRG